MLGDHLGSTSLTTDATGALVSELRYTAWGEVRYASGTTPTDYTYTGQYSYTADFGLMYYNARWYDPYLNHMTQPDSIIPDLNNPQAWNRYSYVFNNPINYIDPSGHDPWWLQDGNNDQEEVAEYYENGGGGSNNWKFNQLIDFVEDEIVNDRGIIKEKHQDDIVDTMNQVVYKAAQIYGNNWNGFFDATNYIFTGWYGHGWCSMPCAHFSTDWPGYFDGASGFHRPDFYEESNQVRHFWVALASAADPYGGNPHGERVAIYGNAYHDLFEDWIGQKDTTIMDYKLSLTGINIASQIGRGKHIQSPRDLAPILKYMLGSGGPGYIGRPINTNFWFTPRE